MMNIFKKILPWKKEQKERYEELSRTITLKLEQIERHEVEQSAPEVTSFGDEMIVSPAEEAEKCRDMVTWYRDLCRDLNEEAELIRESDPVEADKLREKAEWAYRTAEDYQRSAEAFVRMACEREGKPVPSENKGEMQIDRMADIRAANGL